MKKAMIIAMALMLSAGAFAQSVIETVATVGMMTLPAQQISLDKDAKVVQDAMRARLREANLKVKNNEGWMAATEQVFAEVAQTPISFFAKVEEQGRKKNKITVVTICAIPTDLTQNQAVLTGALRSYLESFPRYIERFEAQQSMEQEQENLKKAEKAAASATAAVASIDKDITSLEGKIADKRQEIEKLKAKIRDCEKEIAELEKKIEKQGDKKVEAEKKVEAADENVKAAQGEVDRYRQMAQ